MEGGEGEGEGMRPWLRQGQGPSQHAWANDSELTAMRLRRVRSLHWRVRRVRVRVSVAVMAEAATVVVETAAAMTAAALVLLVAQVVLVAHTLPWVACTMRARGVSAEVRGTREAALTTGQGPRRTMSNTSAVS